MRQVAWFLVLAACGGREPAPTAVVDPPAESIAGQPSEAPVATVDGVAIDARALRLAMIRHGADFLDRYESIEAKERVLEELVRVKVLAASARRAGIADDPDVREAIDKLLAEAYWRERVLAEASAEPPSDADVEAWYREHRAEFDEPARARGAVVFLRFPPRANAAEKTAVRDEAERLLAEARADVAALATRRSDDPRTRARGGDTGFVAEGASIFYLDPPVMTALFALAAPGDVAPPVETAEGVWIVRLLERAGRTTRSLGEVRDEALRHLRAERLRTAQEERYAGLRREAEVQIDRERLREVGPQRSASGPPAFPAGEDAL